MTSVGGGRRVLLVRASALGDVVETVGAVRALAAARPDLELHWVVQPESRAVLAALDIDGPLHCVEHRRQPALRGMAATARRLRRIGFDVALDLQSNWKSAVLCRLSGARERIGVAAAHRGERLSARLLTRRVEVAPGASGRLHPARAAWEVVRSFAPEVVPHPPRLRAEPAALAAERAALQELGIDPSAPFRALVWSGAGDPRDWPVDVLTADATAAAQPSVVVVGPAEAAASLPGLPVLRHGRGSLPRLVALGHLVLGAGGEVLGPDRGATHVLAATGARTRVLFGPQDPAMTAPVGAEVLLRAHGRPDCVPCRARVCRRPEGPSCMAFSTADGDALVAGVVDAAGRFTAPRN